MTGDRDSCITCGDVAVTATVAELDGTRATVEVEGKREHVDVELVAPVNVGDTLLCHAGIAIQRLDAE